MTNWSLEVDRANNFSLIDYDFVNKTVNKTHAILLREAVYRLLTSPFLFLMFANITVGFLKDTVFLAFLNE